METRKTLDAKELSYAMKETGLGTPGHRSRIIEVPANATTMRNRQDLGRQPTKAFRLIDLVHPRSETRSMDRQWEPTFITAFKRHAHSPPS